MYFIESRLVLFDDGILFKLLHSKKIKQMQCWLKNNSMRAEIMKKDFNYECQCTTFELTGAQCPTR